MRVLKSLVIAFSTYSGIPVPQFEWKKEDMKYMLCFFPWIGGIIGLLIYLWNVLCTKLEIGSVCYSVVGTAIPLIVTGGFHVDGFLDTMDAFHSYQSKERKLEILKDSHIGAFAVIMFALYGLCYIGAFSEITDTEVLKTVCAGFFLSRCLSGISILSFQPAKTDGMLYQFADSAQRNVVRATLYLQGLICVCFMVKQSVWGGIVAIAAALCSYFYYYYRTKKDFGGITGDTAGYFVLLCEECMLVVVAVMQLWM